MRVEWVATKCNFRSDYSCPLAHCERKTNKMHYKKIMVFFVVRKNLRKENEKANEKKGASLNSGFLNRFGIHCICKPFFHALPYVFFFLFYILKIVYCLWSLYNGHKIFDRSNIKWCNKWWKCLRIFIINNDGCIALHCMKIDHVASRKRHRILVF